MTYQFRTPNILLAILAAVGLAGCGQPQSNETTAQVEASPARVAVLSVKPETVVLVDELPGRVAAFRTAEIRPQVGGILEKRLFDQGSEVTAGQAMFQINSDVFKAEVASAAAVLQRAEAGVVRSQGKYDRAKQLVPTNAISREAYDDTAADLAQAKANVAEAQATLQRRNLDLAFATVRAPISGRTGQALASEGALASVSSTTPLAIVQQIDRVYVDVRQPATQIDVIREAARSGQLDDASKVPVAILAASGKAYPVAGRALFSDISVDPGTGNVTVRVEVQNPDRILLPGMYVRARMPRGVRHNALLVPQEAVVRDPAGAPQLVIVDDRKRAARRAVALGEIVDRRYVVTSGLKAGETVAMQGQDRTRNDAVVEAVPFTAAAAPATD
ncbi:MAG TPA: efflux RND transporter periplasmic adaptor subunit [Tardiphaga sp.]